MKLLEEINQHQKDLQEDVNKRFDKIESDIKELKESNTMIKQAVMDTDGK